MKKFISLLLAFSLGFSLAVPAFSNEETPAEACDNVPVIVVRGMDFAGMYVDYGTDNEKSILTVDAGTIVKGILKAVASGIINFSPDSAIKEISLLAKDIFKYYSMDESGGSLYNVTMPAYPESADKYENLCEGTSFEYGIVRRCIEEFGEGHTYYINYDWRLDPFVVADDINAAVEAAIENTGHEKVNIICCSMGGQMTLAYLTKYGYEKVNRCIFLSTTFCGAQVASDLLNGRVNIEAENLYGYLAYTVRDNKPLSVLINVLYKAKVFDLLTKLTDFILENYKDTVYQDAIIPVFSHMLPLWGLVQEEDYASAIDYVFGGRENADADFIEKTDRLQKMMKDKTALMNEMIDNGVEIAIVAHYGIPVIPVYENSDYNGDGILETYQMSGYATVAAYGETLGDDYVAANPALVSPDNTVDLSTALFPEYTYIIKGADHVGGTYGTDYSDFIVWLLMYDGEFYAGASDKYPQFMVSDSSQSLSKFN
ncbi:MAG: alpha/beta fold hydrolase [Clostridia bacterium]|nr:alpha/beta fold hydrolase [Clostridia bacterium]